MAASENTPAKALGNFLDMIQKVESNENYLPSIETLSAANMKTLHEEASEALDAYHAAKVAATSARKERVKTVELVKATSTRAINFLKACTDNAATIQQAMTTYRMIQGYKAPSSQKATENTAVAGGEEIKKKSTKQGSQDSLVQNFLKLILVIKSEAAYSPNETDLKVTGLEALVAKFKTDDLATATAEAAMEKSRANLEKLFNHPRTGIKAVMAGAKLYSKAAFGAGSKEFRNLSKIKTPALTF